MFKPTSDEGSDPEGTYMKFRQHQGNDGARRKEQAYYTQKNVKLKQMRLKNKDDQYYKLGAKILHGKG